MTGRPQEMASHVLKEPTIVAGSELEYSVHSIPLALRDDVKAVLPALRAEELDGLKIVATCQRAREDLVKMGEKVSHSLARLDLRFWDAG